MVVFVQSITQILAFIIIGPDSTECPVVSQTANIPISNASYNQMLAGYEVFRAVAFLFKHCLDFVICKPPFLAEGENLDADSGLFYLGLAKR